MPVRRKASAEGKYRDLLRRIEVPADLEFYGEFSDYGRYEGTSYAGHDDLPPGFWVYLHPHWYIWREEVAAPAAPAEKRSWGPEQATGAPDTFEAGDIPTAWASLTPDAQDEWLLLTYGTYGEPVAAAGLMVHATLNPGAIRRVTVFNPQGREVEVWKGQDPTPTGSGRGLSLLSFQVEFEVSRVKVYLGSREVPGWNEIDAVGLIDSFGGTHWAMAAQASSTYAEPNDTPVADPESVPERLRRLEEQLRQLLQELEAIRRQVQPPAAARDLAASPASRTGSDGQTETLRPLSPAAG